MNLPQKLKYKGQAVAKIEWKRTDRRTDGRADRRTGGHDRLLTRSVMMLTMMMTQFVKVETKPAE